MLKKGLIQVYTTNSGRLNFAPIGLALRAAGQDLHVLIAGLLPHDLLGGAVTASSILKPNLVLDLCASEGIGPDQKFPEDKLHQAFQRATDAVLKSAFDVVILKGIHHILNSGMASLKDILSLMMEKPPDLELVLTGIGLPPEILDRADLATEMVVSSSGKDESLTEIITGNGKGKTTYCLGKAMITSCMGVESAFLQFVKSPHPYGEVKAIEKFPNLDIRTMGEGFLFGKHSGDKEKHQRAARRAWEKCLREIFSLKYGLVVLDEINTATYYGLVHAERVREMLFLKPGNLQLLLSGRNAHLEVTAAASTLIEMREIKHPYKKGIKARKGIEF